MKNTSKLILLALLMFLPGIASAQYQTIIATNQTPVDISIATNQVMQVLNFTGAGGTLSVTKEGITQSVVVSEQAGSASGSSAKDTFLVGPATVTIVGNSTDVRKLCLSYKLFDNSTSVGSSLPSNTVVIPADAAGNVNIILESSTDLVTWTAASPGSYGSSTSKRFFRIRAVAQ